MRPAVVQERLLRCFDLPRARFDLDRVQWLLVALLRGVTQADTEVVLEVRSCRAHQTRCSFGIRGGPQVLLHEYRLPLRPPRVDLGVRHLLGAGEEALPAGEPQRLASTSTFAYAVGLAQFLWHCSGSFSSLASVEWQPEWQ